MLSSSVAKVTRRYWESSWGEGERSFERSERTCQRSEWDSVPAASGGQGGVRTGHGHFRAARRAANGASGTRAVAERCLGLRERDRQPAGRLRGQVSAVRGAAQARGRSLERCVVKGCPGAAPRQRPAPSLGCHLSLSLLVVCFFVVIYYVCIYTHMCLYMCIKGNSVSKAVFNCKLKFNSN